MADKKKKWIKGATADAHGQFKAKAEKAGKSTADFASKHADDSGKLGKEARLAETLMKMHKKTSAKSMSSKLYGSKK